MSKNAATISSRGGGWLDWIERAGNRLPHPMTLFIIGAVAVLVISQVAASAGWSVEKPAPKSAIAGGWTLALSKVASSGGWSMSETASLVERTDGDETVSVTARGLLSGDDAYWAIDNLVKNFTAFAPLGVVLVGMLGIGIAERTGAIGALLKVGMLITPQKLLTPAMIFIGVLSSMALDAGYVVLPPIAAALYKSVGRSPLAGLAAVFVGVSAGFSANLFITGLDPLLAGLSTEGAQMLDKDYQVAATSNWWFMIASTFILTLTGWAVTAWVVEPRYSKALPENGGPSSLTDEDREAQRITSPEINGLIWGGGTLAVFLVIVVVLVNPFGFSFNAPLAGNSGPFPRWVHAIVPLLFFCFLLPGLAYGVAAGKVKSDKDVASMMGKTMADMGPYIVLAFFAAQFVAFFKQSNLGEMMARSGGEMLAKADMPPWLILASFVLLVMVANMFIGSASAKYAFFAPVFVPMFMAGGKISPELTQAAYRVGDSCSNIVTPLNPYVVIILVFMQKYVPKGGIGTLVALMLPYALIFGVVWTILLLVWMSTGIELGPSGPLWYSG